jgi:hypothetical protein
MGNISIREHLPTSSCTSNLETRFFLRGVGYDAPCF